ncbi:hypothetical protein PCASD_12602 [Puccinia coronata f. sp. avenae]|uniref:Uncharacterized protein n=1 Tax=Puccinia coronata f. sp. avenae TaxID=200324 RepID=A0A2N5TE10_9BASI|nr:hypothetical protein PCASD_12602 [Puccinia coronata f. sp. avenae]
MVFEASIHKLHPVSFSKRIRSVSSNRTALSTQTLPPATHLQAATPSAQPLSNDYAAQESNSLMLMGLDEIDQLEMEPAYPPDQGIAPSEVFSRAPSTAIESNRSTPVPLPVERQHFAVLRREVRLHRWPGLRRQHRLTA